MNDRLTRLSLILIVSISLVSCKPAQPTTMVEHTNTSQQQVEDVQMSKEQILSSENILAVRQKDQLMIVDPQFPSPLSTYQFSQDELPISSDLFDIQISPSHKWIVWYTPQKGILAQDASTGTVMTTQESSDWLSKNPYFEFSETDDVIYYVTDEGTILNRYDLASSTNEKIVIPFPFGNIFRIAPDGQHVLFISGYAQAKKPQYMITDIQGNNPIIFETDTNMADRFLVTWAPDSSGIIQVASKDILFRPSLNPQTSKTLLQITTGHILELERVKDTIFARDDQDYWHVYSYTQSKEIARTPIAIASELRKPKFYPWTDNQFLITELAGDDELRYNRLWLSSFRGSKKLILSEFGETIVQTSPLKLD